MQIHAFNAPGGIDDLANDAELAGRWSQHMSDVFEISIASVASYLAKNGGGQCQFYNPLLSGRVGTDLPAATTDIPWNGFPRRHQATGPGQATDYAGAEDPIQAGDVRDQDEYLEWFVNRVGGSIASIHFTCEAWDYFDFLGETAPAKVVELYKRWVGTQVQEEDLFPQGLAGPYDRLNRWNTSDGAMHLTHSANNLFAEVYLAATATVRRSRAGHELTQAGPLIDCGRYGEADRNSDPAIGAAVNGLARGRRHVTLADPVGLYMKSFNGAGITLNGAPAGNLFKVVRGAFPLALRAVFELPDELKAQGLTVSDVRIGNKPLQFGGQLAERVTMHIAGSASVDQDIDNVPVATCGGVPQVRADPAERVFAAGLNLDARMAQG